MNKDKVIKDILYWGNKLRKITKNEELYPKYEYKNLSSGYSKKDLLDCLITYLKEYQEVQ